MKKFVLLALASLAFGVQESEFKVYEQILNQLDTKQIPAFVVQTAKPNLPSRVDDMITLKDVSSDGLNIHGEFVLNETKTKKLKGYNKAQILALKNRSFTLTTQPPLKELARLKMRWCAWASLSMDMLSLMAL